MCQFLYFVLCLCFTISYSFCSVGDQHCNFFGQRWRVACRQQEALTQGSAPGFRQCLELCLFVFHPPDTVSISSNLFSFLFLSSICAYVVTVNCWLFFPPWSKSCCSDLYVTCVCSVSITYFICQLNKETGLEKQAKRLSLGHVDQFAWATCFQPSDLTESLSAMTSPNLSTALTGYFIHAIKSNEQKKTSSSKFETNWHSDQVLYSIDIVLTISSFEFQLISKTGQVVHY